METIRSREISAALVLQAKLQLKAIYKDNTDTIIGKCDSQIFLNSWGSYYLQHRYPSMGRYLPYES